MSARRRRPWVRHGSALHYCWRMAETVRLPVPPAGDPDPIPAGPCGPLQGQKAKCIPPCQMGSALPADGTGGSLALNSAILVEATDVPAATAGSEQQNQTYDVRGGDIGRFIIQQRIIWHIPSQVTREAAP